METADVSVAVQGEPGCNSALAAETFFAGTRLELLPCRTFADLFNVVAARMADFALVPVENSLGGAVHQVWELLERSRYLVVGELYYRVRHCLIGHPNVPLQEIRRVYSHEQALAQCRRFLARLVWIDPQDVIATYDTAGAVKMVRARGRREEAAIASPRAAEIYGMQALATDIQTDPDNYTRFLVLRGPEGQPTGSRSAPGGHRPPPLSCDPGSPLKTTLILTVDDNTQPLPRLLERLAAAGFGVLRVETVKVLGQPWRYRVYLDLQADARDAAWDPTHAPVPGDLVHTLRWVGTYPLAPRPRPERQSPAS